MSGTHPVLHPEEERSPDPSWHAQRQAGHRRVYILANKKDDDGSAIPLRA